ncbi:MAG TPA: molybdate ABC transporter permease subunit [Gaiellales bacterium]|nr:molybdate ABC transporter permease subunit [Gaiellales bacterium]
MDRSRDRADRPPGAAAVRLRTAALAVAAGLLVALTAGFFALPLVAIYVQGDVLGGLRSSGATTALRISFESSAIAVGLMLTVGTPVAYLLAVSPLPGRGLLLTLFELPLVLPPAVAGIGLLAAFGRVGLLGSTLHAAGIELPFTFAAVVLAMTFVAGPFYLRQAVSAFAAIDPDLLAASRTLGAGPLRTMLRVAIPVAGQGLGAGAALGWARAIGEFGATIMFAGSLPGVTETAPVAIYLDLEQGLGQALALGGALVAVSAVVLVAVKLLARGGLPRFTPG